MTVCEIRAIDLGYKNGEMERTRDIFKSAVDKAPQFQGTMFRGINVDSEKLDAFLGTMKPGSVFLNGAHSSFTKSQAVADQLGKAVAPGKTQVVFSARSKSGADISGFGGRTKEGEVIARAGSRFKIEGVRREGGKVFVDMVETGLAPGARTAKPVSIAGDVAPAPTKWKEAATNIKSKDFRRSQGEWLTGLSDPEKVALEKWSEANAYTQIRKYQMTGVERGNVPEVTNRLTQALERAPKYQGPMYRGLTMPAEALDSYKVGRVMTMEAHSSFSTKVKIGQQFAAEGQGEVAVLFRANGKTARSIRDLSRIPKEEEVMSMAGSRYRIVDITEEVGSGKLLRGSSAPRKVIIDLEEVG